MLLMMMVVVEEGANGGSGQVQMASARTAAAGWQIA
jgi:hypothetical protein